MVTPTPRCVCTVRVLGPIFFPRLCRGVPGALATRTERVKSFWLLAKRVWPSGFGVGYVGGEGN